MEVNKVLFLNLTVLLVLVGFTTTTVDARFHQFHPSPFDSNSFFADPNNHQSFKNGDFYFFKSSSSSSGGAFTTAKSTPPPQLFRHHNPNIIGESETNSGTWKACFCAGTYYPPQWQCKDITDFFNHYDQWTNSFLFFKQEVFFMHISNGGDVPQGVSYFLPPGPYNNFP